MAVNPEFWHGKQVFITGHTGFKGSWLSLWLQSAGAVVHGYSTAPPTVPNLFTVARIADGMATHTVADVRDGMALKNAMRAATPAVVFHLAAQPLVRHSYVEPVETYAVNVLGTVNVLEAVRECPSARALINVTTDKCYENREWLWGYREHEALGGRDPYSSSKACSELVTAAYRASFFSSGGAVAVATARAGNVIGGGDWARDRLVPDILTALCAGKPVRIRNPDSIRPWQYVLDPLAGYLRLAEQLASPRGSDFAESWNFGPADEDARPVRWIAEHLVNRWDRSLQWLQESSPQPHEATYLKLDCSKARAQLMWSPRYRLNQALDAIIDWHRAYEVREDMRAVTLRQIAAYMSIQSQ